MNLKHDKMISNAMEMKTIETDDSIRKQKETDQMEQDETELKITKQTDIDEKEQSDESFDKMKLIKENLMLLSEIDKLKKSNRTMSQRLYYLETGVKAPLKKP